MQGLRPYAQDENALAGLHRPAALKAFSGEPAVGAPGAKKAGGFPVPSVRKALGNITNRGVFDVENGLPGKTPAAGTAPAQERRALGDITNSSAAAPASLPRTAFKPAVQPAAQQVAAAPASAVAATEPRSRLDELAEGGVEWPAGRGCQALELDRLAREDADIQRRLAALANYRASPLPNFFPLWGPSGMEQMLKKDALSTPPASPVKHAAGLSPPAMLDLGDPALDLPQVALPDINDALSQAGLDGF